MKRHGQLVESVYINGKRYTSPELAAADNSKLRADTLKAVISSTNPGVEIRFKGYRVSYHLADKTPPVKHDALLVDEEPDDHGTGAVAWADADKALYDEFNKRLRSIQGVNDSLIKRLVYLEGIVSKLAMALGGKA